MLRRASCASTFGSRSPAASAASMSRPETPEEGVRDDRADLDAGVFQQLLGPLNLLGPGVDQVFPLCRGPDYAELCRARLLVGDVAGGEFLGIIRGCQLQLLEEREQRCREVGSARGRMPSGAVVSVKGPLL